MAALIAFTNSDIQSLGSFQIAAYKASSNNEAVPMATFSKLSMLAKQ